MKILRYEYIKSAMGVFSLGLLQDFINISSSLREYGIEESELREYVSDNKRIFAGSSAIRNLEMQSAITYCTCPKCGDGLNIEPVNTGPRNVIEELDRNGEKYNSLATCKDERGCGWQRYSVKSLESLIRSFFPKELVLELEEMDDNEPGKAHGIT